MDIVIGDRVRWKSEHPALDGITGHVTKINPNGDIEVAIEAVHQERHRGYVMQRGIITDGHYERVDDESETIQLLDDLLYGLMDGVLLDSNGYSLSILDPHVIRLRRQYEKLTGKLWVHPSLRGDYKTWLNDYDERNAHAVTSVRGY